MAWNILRRRGRGSRIALVSASFGAIDALPALPVHDGVDAFYYTDEAGAAAATPEAAATWTRIIVPNYPRYDFHPRLRAKYFKLQIHRLDEVRQHRWLAWADSSLRFRDLRFLTESAARLRRVSSRSRVLLVPHPDRRTVSEEFRYVQGEIESGNEYLTVRYRNEKMPEQIEDYGRRGWDLHAKLWCGTIWLIENSDALQRAWDDWWDQNLRFGIMDQLSLPVILAKHRIHPQSLDVKLWDNPHFYMGAHLRNM